MFGTLLGLLRHSDFILRDDDLDIIIFDIEKFEKKCIKKFKEKGDVVLQTEFSELIDDFAAGGICV